MQKILRTVALAFALAAALAIGQMWPTLIEAQAGLWVVNSDQPSGTVQWRVFGRHGSPATVGLGTAEPTVGNSGAPPVDGELYTVTAASTTPSLRQYDANAAEWHTVIAPPRTNMTEAQVWFPQAAGMSNGAAEAEDALATDDIVVCYRFYNPAPITVTEAQVWIMSVTSPAVTDLVGIAIYNDADAGTQLAECTAPWASDGAAATCALAASLETDWYRLCATQSDVSAADWMAIAPGTAQIGLNNDTVASEAAWADATNTASNANMPATTGALNTTVEAMPIIKLQSN